MQLGQFVVSRAHTTFAEVTESVKTYQELIEVDSVTHIFKNVSFNDVNCTLCNESHKSLDCPSLRSIIEMEVSSSCSPNTSSSDSRSRSPNRDYYRRRKVFYRDLVHHLDHLVVMIGVMMLQVHPMIIGTIGINHPIEIATIAIDNTALTIRIGKITTRMVSPLLGVLIGIGMPIMLKNGYTNDVIRVQANLTFRIDQIMQETHGIRAPQGLKEIKIDVQISSQGTMLTIPILVIREHL